MIDNEAFGIRLKQARKAKGLSQRQLGARIFYTQGMICNLEKGKSLPSATSVVALSAALDVTADWLLMGE